MKRLLEFLKTTLIGGLLVVLPLYLVILLLAKVLSGLSALVEPLTAQIPATVEFRNVVAIVIILLVCFLVGLVVRTAVGSRAIGAFETGVLGRVPGYSLVRGLVGRVAGNREDAPFQPALIEIEDGGLAPGFIVEETGDGRYVVLVPSVPTPAAGSLFVLDRTRVHPVDVPFATAVRVITQWGAGTGEMVRAMRTGSESSTGR